MMWVLIRIPKISTGLEGDKYDMLIRIGCVSVLVPSMDSFLMHGPFFSIAYTILEWFLKGAVSALSLCVLLLTLRLMDKCVAYHEPVVEAVEAQPEPVVEAVQLQLEPVVEATEPQPEPPASV